MHKFARYALLATAAIAPAAAQAQQPTATAAQPKPAQAPAFIPANFNPPTLVETPGFKLVPLGPAVVKVDFDAYMSSIEHLQKTFTRSTNWPHKGISDADAMLDMQTEDGRFKARKSFAYSVLTSDGRRERGSVYVSPSPVGGYDAVVRLWVTKAEYDAGFDTELYKWVVDWVRKDWPFRNVAYPGRSIDWATWDSAVAANTPRKAVAGEKSP
jgi:hypothetical protein